jgi:hypothetical protein
MVKRMTEFKWNIFLANLDPVLGSEQGKTRPVVVISEEGKPGTVCGNVGKWLLIRRNTKLFFACPRFPPAFRH